MPQARSFAVTAALITFLVLIWKEIPAMRRYVKMERM